MFIKERIFSDKNFNRLVWLTVSITLLVLIFKYNSSGISLVTFLMTFAIQRTEIKDTIAMQLKLNELIAASEGSANHLINFEDNFTLNDLIKIKKLHNELFFESSQQGNSHQAQSVADAINEHIKNEG